MPGLSPDGKRFERIIGVINDGLKDNVSTLDATLLLNNQNCWRCERNKARDQWTLCEECRAYLACETNHDPGVNDKPPVSQVGYSGWSAAHLAWRNRGAVTIGTNAQSA